MVLYFIVLFMHFVSEDFAETPYISWNAAICTYPCKMGASTFAIPFNPDAYL